jgi:hypothetical protein
MTDPYRLLLDQPDAADQVIEAFGLRRIYQVEMRWQDRGGDWTEWGTEDRILDDVHTDDPAKALEWVQRVRTIAGRVFRRRRVEIRLTTLLVSAPTVVDEAALAAQLGPCRCGGQDVFYGPGEEATVETCFTVGTDCCHTERPCCETATAFDGNGDPDVTCCAAGYGCATAKEGEDL